MNISRIVIDFSLDVSLSCCKKCLWLWTTRNPYLEKFYSAPQSIIIIILIVLIIIIAVEIFFVLIFFSITSTSNEYVRVTDYVQVTNSCKKYTTRVLWINGHIQFISLSQFWCTNRSIHTTSHIHTTHVDGRFSSSWIRGQNVLDSLNLLLNNQDINNESNIILSIPNRTISNLLQYLSWQSLNYYL